MEVVAALGLACNVMQVVSFGRDLISVARHAYEAGSVEEDLTDQAAHLSKLSTSLESSLGNSTQSANAAQKELLEVAHKCQQTAVDLYNEITKLCPAAGKRSRGRAVGASFKVFWRRGRLEKLEKSMSHWQQAMDSGLLLRICSISEAQALEHRDDLSNLHFDLHKVVQQLVQGNSKVTATIASESMAIQSHTSHEVSRSHDILTQHVTTQAQDTRDHVARQLGHLQLGAATKEGHDKLLKSLKYGGMAERESTVAQSYVDTFKWIFSSDLRSWSNFATWLSSDQKLYWISGKPGSGKSTLVKFILREQKTKDLLAPGTIILSHYLWSPGQPMQKSVRGLLCVLLYKLLHEEGSLTAPLLQGLENLQMKDCSTDWSFPELLAALVLALSSCLRPICIFLDGLDEISPSEGPSELMDLVDQLSAIDGVKACVSSRPEPAFQKRYGAVPRLRLQDLTKSDMRRFCEETLKSFREDLPEAWIKPDTGPPIFSNIIGSLVQKAEGVFLWVHLALRSIRRGCSNSDSEEEIQQRIRSLPSDLDKLYRAMWTRANVDRGVYERNAARYLNLILEAGSVTSAFLMPFFEDWNISVFALMVACEPSVQNAFLGSHVHPRSQELKDRCLSLMQRIESHCAGLVEFREIGGPRDPHVREAVERDGLRSFTNASVVFIHRTAFDFLTDTEWGREILKVDPTSREDRLMSLIQASLVQSRMWYSSGGKTERCSSFAFMDALMEIIWTASYKISDTDTEKLLKICEDLWNRTCERLQAEDPRALIADFLGLAATHGFTSFIQARLDRLAERQGQTATPAYRGYLLYQACDAGFRGSPPPDTFSRWRAKFSLIRYLIESGANGDSKFFAVSYKFGYVSPHLTWMTTPALRLIQGVNMMRGPIEIQFLTELSATANLLQRYVDPGQTVVLSLRLEDETTATFSICHHLHIGFLRGLASENFNQLYVQTSLKLILPLFLRQVTLMLPEVEDDSAFQGLRDLVRIKESSCSTVEAPARLLCFTDSRRHSFESATTDSARNSYESVTTDSTLDDDISIIQYFQRPLSPAYLDSELLCLKLSQCLRGAPGPLDERRAAVNAIITMADDSYEESEYMRTAGDFSRVFQSHAFFGWPTLNKIGTNYPPPMFEDDEDQANLSKGQSVGS